MVQNFLIRQPNTIRRGLIVLAFCIVAMISHAPEIRAQAMSSASAGDAGSQPMNAYDLQGAMATPTPGMNSFDSESGQATGGGTPLMANQQGFGGDSISGNALGSGFGNAAI